MVNVRRLLACPSVVKEGSKKLSMLRARPTASDQMFNWWLKSATLMTPITDLRMLQMVPWIVNHKNGPIIISKGLNISILTLIPDNPI